MHMGAGHTLGERGGEQGHTLSISEIPTHVHSAIASSATTTSAPLPTGNFLAQESRKPYSPPHNNLIALAAGSLADVGGSPAHLNMQAFLALNCSIARHATIPVLA